LPAARLSLSASFLVVRRFLVVRPPARCRPPVSDRRILAGKNGQQKVRSGVLLTAFVNF
jgi:hypothetical protein